MKIRVTTRDQSPTYESLLGERWKKASRNRLSDFPWLFVNGGLQSKAWEQYRPEEFAAAAAKAPGHEVVIDLEKIYQWRDVPRQPVSLATWVYDPTGTVDALARCAAVLQACSGTGKLLWLYPNLPSPLGLPQYHTRLRDYAELFALERRLFEPYLAGAMIQVYAQRDMSDWNVALETQLVLCGSNGVTPKLALCAASYQAIEQQGWEGSFVGRESVLSMCRACRDRGLDVAFFNPAHPPALEALTEAALTL